MFRKNTLVWDSNSKPLQIFSPKVDSTINVVIAPNTSYTFPITGEDLVIRWTATNSLAFSINDETNTYPLVADILAINETHESFKWTNTWTTPVNLFMQRM